MNKCANYQRAAQALAVDTKLHKLFDDTRHEGKNEMTYTIQQNSHSSDSDMSISDHEDNDDEQEYAELDVGVNQAMEEDDDYLSSDEEEDKYYVEDDDEEEVNDEVNMNAYVTDDTSQKTEQGGVLHVVHAWIQQAQPEKVSSAYQKSS